MLKSLFFWKFPFLPFSRENSIWQLETIWRKIKYKGNLSDTKNMFWNDVLIYENKFYVTKYGSKTISNITRNINDYLDISLQTEKYPIKKHENFKHPNHDIWYKHLISTIICNITIFSTTQYRYYAP